MKYVATVGAVVLVLGTIVASAPASAAHRHHHYRYGGWGDRNPITAGANCGEFDCKPVYNRLNQY
jgi:hypothetical protein